jgi:nucleoside-diphosphate-sugar epimerase
VKLLVFGGTGFLGRYVVEAALAAGHEPTLFNRGQTNPELFPDVERIIGDRDADLAPLRGRGWDAAIDVPARLPRHVRAAVEALADVEHYTFVSTISVYRDFSRRGIDESASLQEYDPSMGDEDMQWYGARKAECERIVGEAFRDRALIVRPGLIVGPHDPTDRFTYWPARMTRGGEILAPGPPERQVQFVDVRDLAEWIVRLIEERQTGAFNATDEGVSMGELLSGAQVTWVPDKFLLEHGVGEWMELPLWIGDPEWLGMHHVDVSRAVEAGLRFRPLDETVRDTAEWAAGQDEHEPQAGLAPERERELLEAWRTRS